MSYLNLPSFNVADSTKGTISLWFRVSQDSVDKAKAHGDSYPSDVMKWDILRGTIPLVTFGRKLDGRLWDSVSRLDCSATFQDSQTGLVTTHNVFSFHPANPVDSPRELSHIGLSCWGHTSGGEPNPVPTLLMVFQTQSIPTAAGLYNERVECHFGPPGTSMEILVYETIYEASYIRASWPVAFYIEPNFHITIDTWHHLLASWDFSTAVDTVATAHTGPITGYDKGKNVSGACKFYYAFDDENREGKENMGSAWAYKGPNDVVPEGAFLADFDFTPHDPATDILGNPVTIGNVNAIPQWHFSPSPLPVSGGRVGLPASAEYVDNVYHVEMAEFQFFADLALDTSDTTKRRAFVAADGRPVKPADTEKMLGKKPDILLHGTNNWKQGKNTGSTGIEINTEGDEVVNPVGQFQHIGLIKKYTPDPKLSEDGTA